MKIKMVLLLLFITSNALATGTWKKEVSSVPWSSREDHTSFFLNDKIWITGGYSSGNGWLNDIWSSYDGINWTREIENAPWSKRSGHTTTVFNGKVWMISGGFEKDVWSSSDGINWEKSVENAIWTKRKLHTAIVFSNKLWIIGGYEAYDDTTIASYADKNDVYSSPDGINWTKQNDFYKWGLWDHSSVVFKDKMWILGGQRIENPDPTLATPEGYLGSQNGVYSSIDGINWIKETDSPWATSNHSSVVFNNKIWMIGGVAKEVGERRSNNVWSSVDGISWIKSETPLWTEREGHTSVVFNDKIFLINGDAGFNSANDIWSLDSNVTKPSLDIDSNNEKKGFTDGFLIIRYLLGAKGNTLTEGVVGNGATRSTSKIEQYLNDNKLTMLDVDGNGKAKGFTDGFLIIRYLLGARGQTLIDGVVASDATRATASEIEAFLQSKI